MYGITKITDGRFISCNGDQVKNKLQGFWYWAVVFFENYIWHTDTVVSVIKMIAVIFVTVSSDVIVNLWILQNGRHVNSFTGSSTDGFIYTSRVNDEIFLATNDNMFLFV